MRVSSKSCANVNCNELNECFQAPSYAGDIMWRLLLLSSRWAPASTRQRFRLLHHPGSGGGRVGGGAVHTTGMWLGQIMSQSVPGRQEGEAEEKPRWSPLDHPAPFLYLQLSNTTKRNKDPQSHPPLSLVHISLPKTPNGLLWLLSSAPTAKQTYCIHHFFPHQQPAPAAQTDITPPASVTFRRVQHKHRSCRASLAPACSFNCSNISTLFDFWVVITGDTFHKLFFLCDGGISITQDALDASTVSSSVLWILDVLAVESCGFKYTKRKKTNTLAVKSPLQAFMSSLCHFDYWTVSCHRKG